MFLCFGLLPQKIDQTISVRGKLQPLKSVVNLDSPSSGVVQELFVSDGDIVDVGDPLLSVEVKGLTSKEECSNKVTRAYFFSVICTSINY